MGEEKAVADDKQMRELEAFKEREVNLGHCPYSGLKLPECKSWLCDCFEFEDEYGVSRK
jgi:hypothetical protein